MGPVSHMGLREIPVGGNSLENSQKAYTFPMVARLQPAEKML
jgi:hypothetical protein